MSKDNVDLIGGYFYLLVYSCEVLEALHEDLGLFLLHPVPVVLKGSGYSGSLPMKHLPKVQIIFDMQLYIFTCRV